MPASLDCSGVAFDRGGNGPWRSCPRLWVIRMAANQEYLLGMEPAEVRRLEQQHETWRDQTEGDMEARRLQGRSDHCRSGQRTGLHVA